MTPPTSHNGQVARAAGSSGACVRLMSSVLAAWLALGAGALAQVPGDIPTAPSPGSPSAAPEPPVSSPEEESAASGSSESSESDGDADSAVYGMVREVDGGLKPVRLPPGTKMSDFMEWISAVRGLGYGMNSVEVTGSLGDEGPAELTATLTIVVHRDQEWVRVPLGFQEAVFADVVEHEHPGEGSWVYDGFSPETGHSVMLRGMGKHQLRLSLLAPLSNEIDETLLSLTTPSSAATTSWALDFPEDVEVQTDRGVLRTSHETPNSTTIDWVGPGGPIEFSWHPRPETARPQDLTVRTVMTVSFTSGACEIRARQTITPLSGRIAHIEARIPQGFSYVNVEGEYYRPRSARVAEDGRTVSLELEEPQADPVELTWQLTAPLGAESELTIGEFALTGVPESSQSGQVQFEPTAAFRVDIVKASGASPAVRSDATAPAGESEESNPPELPPTHLFESHPFTITARVRPVAPEFDVRPELVFTIHPDRLDLEAMFGVSVEEGELQEMRFKWRTADWNITQIRSGSIQETNRTGSHPPIDIQVPDFASFEIPIFASMQRESVTGRFEIPLPEIEALEADAVARRYDRVLAVRHPSNVSVEIRGTNGEPLPGTDDSSAIRLPEPVENERIDSYLVPSTVSAVEFEIKRVQQQIETDTVIQVRPRGEDLMVKQWFDYDISFDPVALLRVEIPETLFAQDLEFIDGSGRSYPVDVIEREDGLVTAVVRLNSTVTGRMSLSTSYVADSPVDRGASGTLAMPVIRPLDGEFGTARLNVAPLPYHTVAVDAPDWSRGDQPAELEGYSTWQADQSPASISLTLAERPPEAIFPPTMSKVLLRSSVQREGQVHTVVDCLIDQSGALLVLEFPADATPGWFRWRGRAIDPEIVERGGRSQVTLSLEEGAGDPVLSFEYKLAAPNPLGFLDREQIPAALFGDDIAIGEVLWRVSLPESEHLFTNPAAYRPRFEWGLDGGFWSRGTVPSVAEVEDWFGAEIAAMHPEFENGHEYVFSRSGGVAPLSFSVVAKSLVVLIGAGIAILLGYAFANGLVPYQRYVIPGLVVLLMLLWAFFPDQMQILLQPALLGFVLVGAALLAERFLQRRQARLAEAAPSAADFVTILPGDQSDSAPSAGIGSEEPTVVRAAQHRESPEPGDDNS